MRLSNAEKLILTMLADIHKELNIQGDVDARFVTKAIYTGNTWALSWEMQSIVGDSPEPTPPIVSEVVDIIDMWSFIEEAYSSFDDAERKRVKDEAEPFGEHVEFAGFDGNNETEHMSIARFLVEEMNRFSRFKGRDLNSHYPSIDGYREMLAVFNPIRETLIGHGLSVDQLVAVLQAKRR
ncbi:YfbU family protein [Oleiagrimonas soli]|uniref:YfbU family protein n=1 Tax=Oleiagrimonas soli TaxID=1543381 RepID=A0A841KM73_9GAMM|nr:YfbU family protein [Oleiagrimonas soli]MBB6184929.1 hypothetical protein [Oleiagrimonas soli]